MNAAELVRLHATANRRPNALKIELTRAPMDALVSLAYGPNAKFSFADVPDQLASMAYDEMERRQTAVSRLLATNPTLAAKVMARLP